MPSFLDLKEWKDRLAGRFSGEPRTVEDKLKSAQAEMQAGRLDCEEGTLRSWAQEHGVDEQDEERFIREALRAGADQDGDEEATDLQSVMKSVQAIAADVAAMREDAEELFGPGIAFSLDRLEELSGVVEKLKSKAPEPSPAATPDESEAEESEEVLKLKSQIAQLEQQVAEIGAQPVDPKQPVIERNDDRKGAAAPKRSEVLRTLQKGYSAGRIELADITQYETSGQLSRRAETFWSENQASQPAA